MFYSPIQHSLCKGQVTDEHQNNMNVKTVNEYLKLLKLYIITSFKLYILREKKTSACTCQTNNISWKQIQIINEDKIFYKYWAQFS